MAAPDFKARFGDAQTLLNYGYANCKLYEDKEHLPLPQMPVTGGVEDEVALTYEGTFSYLSLKGEDLGAIEKNLVLEESIPAPVEPGRRPVCWNTPWAAKSWARSMYLPTEVSGKPDIWIT